MKFKPLNDLKSPPKHKVHPGWFVAAIICGVIGLAVLFKLDDILQWVVTSTFQWRQDWANAGLFWAFSLIWEILIFVIILIIVIIIVLYTTLAERKVIAYFQIRQGPNRAGPWGILQPFADMFKILIKEDITPLAADKWVFNIAPLLILVPTLLVFTVIPFTKGYIDMDHTVVPLDTKENRDLYEASFGHNVLDITFGKKKSPNLENNIQLAVGELAINQISGMIGSATIFPTADYKLTWEELPEDKKVVPPRIESELKLVSLEGQSVDLRTEDGKNDLWVKGEVIGTTKEGKPEKYRVHFFVPQGDSFSIEPGENGAIILASGDKKFNLSLDSDPVELTLGGKPVKIGWQTDQTYTFYMIPRDINIGIIFILAVTSLSVIIIFMAGWASNNKWSLFGAMRAAAQMISYEVPMGLSIMGVVLMAGSTSMVELVEAQRHVWYVIPQFLGFLIYFTCAVAEVNRCPFDMPEAESELVSGFHTEYSGLKFGFFYLAEYANMFLIAALSSIIFFGGWYGPWKFDDWSVMLFGRFTAGLLWFFLKCFIFIVVLVWIRATFPRLRVDHLMEFAWKALLPLALVNLLYTGLFTFSDWNLSIWIQNQWKIRDSYIWALYRYPNQIFMIPLTIAIIFLVLTDVYGAYKERKRGYVFLWSPPTGIQDVPQYRRDALKKEDEYQYVHKGFKFGKWLKGSETEKDVPGYKGDDTSSH